MKIQGNTTGLRIYLMYARAAIRLLMTQPENSRHQMKLHLETITTGLSGFAVGNNELTIPHHIVMFWMSPDTYSFIPKT